MSMDEKILAALEELKGEVRELRKANEEQAEQLRALQQARFVAATEAEQELLAQIAYSSPSLTKWIRSLDQLMELKEDLVPLTKPMLEEIVASLDEVTHTFDFNDFKEVIRQVVLNLPNIAQVIQMMGGVIDLKNETEQIAKDAFEDAIVRLEELKQKGFFDSMQEVVRIMELVGQRTLDLDASQVQPINGLWGLYAAMKKPEVRDGLGVLFELVSVLSVVKTPPVATKQLASA